MTKLLQTSSRLRPLPALRSTASHPTWLSPDQFAEQLLLPGRPGLIRGLLNGADSPYRWSACQEWPGLGADGPLHGLRRLQPLQDAVVDVEVAPMGRGYGDGVRGNDGPKDDQHGWTQIRMPFNLFQDAFIDGRIPWSTADTEQATPPMVGYVAQQDLFQEVPELMQQCPPLPHTLAGPRGEREQWRRNLWIGGAGTFTPLHCDPYHNLFAQVVGTKRVHLIPPHLAPALSLFGRASRQANTSRIPTEWPLLQRTTPSSSASERQNEQWPDLDKVWADPEAVHVVLEAGDVLFIPQGWYHCVASLSISASVNAWFR